MRQVIQTYTVAKFSELDVAKQSKIVDKFYDINVDDNYWNEHILDDYRSKLEKLGFHDIKFQWSGFSSQGDGASFKAKHQRGDVSTQGFYCHSGTMSCDNPVILKVVRRIAEDLYRDLQKTYDYLTSKESIIETLNANEYEFNIDTLKLE
jgi:hypothetical protein